MARPRRDIEPEKAGVTRATFGVPAFLVRHPGFEARVVSALGIENEDRDVKRILVHAVAGRCLLNEDPLGWLDTHREVLADLADVDAMEARRGRVARGETA